MVLITSVQRKQMEANGKASAVKNEAGELFDCKPVVKLFTPDGGATWLLSEIHPNDPDIAFGLCDLGLGFPELGSVSISEIESVHGKLGLPVERDLHFTPSKTLLEYSKEARQAQRICA